MDRSELERAYRATRYTATRDGETISIAVGEPLARLDSWLDAARVSEWAYITACNPRSRRLAPEENALRMAALVVDLGVIGWPLVHGAGVPSEGDWDSEPSVLVLGLSRPAALELARRYEQHAIVCGRRGEAAELVWTDADGP